MASANVVNTSVIPSTTRGAPFYNDYLESSGFQAMVFRPGYAVQARELTQIGTMSQIQLERLGRHLFTEGSIVQGGQLSIDSAVSINLASQYAGTDVDISDFKGKLITFGSANTKVQAQVITAAAATDTDPPTLMVKYLTGDEFTEGSTIKVNGEEVYANVDSSGAFSRGLTASISDGTFFISGYLVLAPAQIIPISKYITTANVKVGLELSESIVTENDDSTLLDPALGSSNYQAPGAARYKIELILAKRDYDSEDDEKYIELTRLYNGIQQKLIKLPIYSEIEETFARRTYDESGNYTTKPFRLSLLEDPGNSANVIARLDPGKAYVFGYEFETIAPQDLIIERTRDSEEVALYDISTAYGNYINMRNLNGTVDITSMPLVDLHCVPWTYVNNANTNTYGSTKIGTARIRNLNYFSSGNTANGQTFRYSTYIFDSRLSSITGNATGGSANTIVLNLPGISANNDAYNRAIIRITGGTSSGDQRIIQSYNGAIKTATVTTDFTETPDANSVFSIDFTIKETESMIIGTGGGSLTANLDVCYTCKDDGTSTGNTVVKEPAYSSLIFPFPNEFIKDGLTVNNYRYKKKFASRTFTAGVGTATAGTGEAFIGTGSLSESIMLANYIVFVTDPGTSGLVEGQIVSFSDTGRSISVSGSTATFDANLGGDFVADIYANIDINSRSETNPKSKTLVSANTTHITSAASNASILNSSTNTTIYLSEGQVHIQNPNRIPTVEDSLYISDCKNIQVFDLNGATITPGTALSGYTDVTSKYQFNNGQKDTHYDHGGLILKSSVSAPKGPLIVCVDFYQHVTGVSDGYGYMSVDSYPNSDTTAGYADIPYYTDNKGVTYRLSDVIDFRPKRQNASNTSPNFTLEGIRIPVPNEEYTVTFDHYLERKDLLVLTKDKKFKHIKGIAAQYPKPPTTPDEVMVLYKLNMPPYVLYPSNVNVQYVENKRYTMRDVGNMDTRLKNMEYYVTLSFLEKSATDLTIKDVNGLERTKYGILADAFTGHQFGDVKNTDYRCSVDFVQKELRPFFKQTNAGLEFATGDGNYKRNGTTITLNYDEKDFIVQNTASKAENVQPYLIAKFIGQVTLVPDNDIWVDTDRQPVVVLNDSGVNDAWQSLAAALGEDYFGTEWNSWETHWTGRVDTADFTTFTGEQTRTGTETQLNIDTIIQNLGDKVLDVSIIPFIRSREIDFLATNLRPTRQVYFYFDTEQITGYIQKADIIKISSNTKFNDTQGLNEDIISGANTAKVLLSRPDTDGNTLLYIVDVNGYFEYGQTITGNNSANTATVISYNRLSGNAEGGTTATINLALGSSNVSDYYTGNTVYLVTGTGAGQNSSITAYNAATRVATVSPAFSTAPISNTKYSIGIHKTTTEGDIVGKYMIPSNDTISFRTGDRNFRIVDTLNDLDNATTRGDAVYYSQGLLQTKVNQSVGIATPTIVTQTLSQTVGISRTEWHQQDNSIGGSNTEGWGGGDPLAQTFIIDSKNHPSGIFLNSVDLFFKSKDETLPVWIEIRPTVNGYPSSSIVLPFSRKTLYPNEINISDNPSAGNTNTKTTFVFSNPIYLEPDKEYALVVQTNSLNYEAYVSELGKTRIGSDRIISEQPYIGSLFKSQNASTWTPFQFEDLMFVMKICSFTTSSSTIYLENVKPTSNISMDWMHVQTNALKLANTSLDYAFKSTNMSDLSVDSAFVIFNPDENYRHDQRKILHNLSSGSLNVRATMSTSNPDISPIIDLTRYGVIAIENWVNNANLSNTNIVLSDDGVGYVGSNVSITIDGGDSLTTANAYVGTVSGGNVTSIIMDSGGSYYTGRANIAFSGGGATNAATATIASELDPSGGPILSKYITKKVILNEGFNAGDLRVYLTAYKPIGTEIVVYYKIKSENDPDKFTNKPYVKMEQITPSNRYSKSRFSESDVIEYEFRPSSSENAVTYTTDDTTYDSFNEFSIKVGLLSDDTIVVPIVKDLRAIALPASAT